jgi:DNA-binding protein HU-beta
MNKTEFVKAVATATGYTQKDVKAVLEAAQNVVFNTIKNEEVKIFDGLTATAVFKEAHEARSPLTGGTVQVPAKYVPKMKIGKAFKDAINA